MIAVTSPERTPNETSRTTRDAPKYASSDSAAMHAGVAALTADGCSIIASAAALACVGSFVVIGIGTSISVAGTESEPRPRDVTGRETDDEDESEEDERSRPGLRVLIFIR
jgi:hypothetical protein